MGKKKIVYENFNPKHQTGEGKVGTEDYIWAICERLTDELPYDEEDNELVVNAVREYLKAHLDELEDWIGTGIVETDYFVDNE